MQLTPHRPRQQRGVSLIESLIALLVLALGVLGLAGLQTRTLVEVRLSNGRSQALLMANDLAERVRLNRAQGLNSYELNDWGAPPSPAVDCNSAPCNGAQLAVFDLHHWRSQVKASLPQGNARVFVSPEDPQQLGILFRWSNNTGTTSSAKPVDTATFNAPFAVDTGVSGVSCHDASNPPERTLCHLVFIRP